MTSAVYFFFQPVGCDMMLGSSAREDKCRECRGTGANCQTTDGVLDNNDFRKGNKYHYIPLFVKKMLVGFLRVI